MPNSFSSKPGFYDEPSGDHSSDPKSAGAKKTNQADNKKKATTQKGGNDSKGFVFLNKLVKTFVLTSFSLTDFKKKILNYV